MRTLDLWSHSLLSCGRERQKMSSEEAEASACSCWPWQWTKGRQTDSDLCLFALVRSRSRTCWEPSGRIAAPRTACFSPSKPYHGFGLVTLCLCTATGLCFWSPTRRIHCGSAKVVWVAMAVSDLTGSSTVEPLMLWVKTQGRENRGGFRPN